MLVSGINKLLRILIKIKNKNNNWLIISLIKWKKPFDQGSEYGVTMIVILTNKKQILIMKKKKNW